MNKRALVDPAAQAALRASCFGGTLDVTAIEHTAAIEHLVARLLKRESRLMSVSMSRAARGLARRCPERLSPSDQDVGAALLVAMAQRHPGIL